jgi:type II secretory pathway predicted ATPase ExeA
MGAASSCDKLGVPGDEYLHYDHATPLNVCYADQASLADFRPVKLDHQRQFCLKPDYALCPTYLFSVATAHLRGSRKVQTKSHLEFFGLQQEPFFVVPQPRFLCETESQQQAHSGLRWLIDNHHGLGLLLGAVGTGKTLLCQALHEELASDSRYVSVLLLTPSYRSELALMAELLAQWHLHPRQGRTTSQLEAIAHEFLADAVLTRNRTAVLLIDEAQNLPRRLLQQICRLLNWQDGGQQLLQVVLEGQPGLQRGLERVPALRDRVVLECVLTALTLSDTQKVINGRLQRAGCHGDLFAPSAVSLIHECTAGMPRKVTIACLKCLWVAYLQGQQYITQEIVQAAVKDGSDNDLCELLDEKTAHMVDSRSKRAHESVSPMRRLFQHLQPRNRD